MEGKEAQRGATEKAHSVARQRDTHTQHHSENSIANVFCLHYFTDQQLHFVTQIPKPANIPTVRSADERNWF